MSVRLVRKVGKKLVDIIVLDAVLSHDIKRVANVTENPIESGSTVSDHIQTLPPNVSVTGFVSNSPVSLLSFGVIPQFDGTRAKTAYDALVQTFKNKELVQVQSELEIFDDMAITALDVPRDGTNYNALAFTASFRKIIKVGTYVVELKTDVEPLAATAADLGKQTPSTASVEETGESSLLLQGLKGVGILQ